MSDQMPGLRGQHDSRWLTSETRIPQFRFLRQCCLQVTWSGINAKTYSEEETKPTQKKKKEHWCLYSLHCDYTICYFQCKFTSLSCLYFWSLSRPNVLNCEKQLWLV